MNLKQLVALWYGGLGVISVLIFYAISRETILPLIPAIIIVATLFVYIFQPAHQAERAKLFKIVGIPVGLAGGLALTFIMPEATRTNERVAPRALYVTNPFTRDELRKLGYDPDMPGAAEILYKHGYGPDLGEQPDQGAYGRVQATAQSAAKKVANLGIGLVNLPFDIARRPKPFTPYGPSPVEQEHPIAAGAGHLAGLVAPLLIFMAVLFRRKPFPAEVVAIGRWLKSRMPGGL